MSTCVLIINPSSGKAVIQNHMALIHTKLENRFDLLQIHFTEAAGDAERFAYQAASANCEAIICAGGDGTVREVVNGIMQSENKVKLGIIPTGTINDVARSLGIPLTLKEALDMFLTAKTKWIDVGKVNEEYFISLIAVGGIPAAIHDVGIEAKTKWGALSYLMNGARYSLNQKPFALEVEMNGRVMRGKTSLFVISLHNSVAGMPKFFRQAKSDDGYLRVMLYPTFHFLGAAKFVGKIIVGNIEKDKNIAVLPFEKATFHVEGDVPINVDGDRRGSFPLEVRVLPQALEVFVPNEKRQDQ